VLSTRSNRIINVHVHSLYVDSLVQLIIYIYINKNSVTNNIKENISKLINDNQHFFYINFTTKHNHNFMAHWHTNIGL